MVEMSSGSQQKEAISQAVVCKLPLLDGEGKATPGQIVAEVNRDVSNGLRGLLVEDEKRLRALICAAWGLLLRCYTGQDEVCFDILKNSGIQSKQPSSDPPADRSSLRISCREESPLFEHVSMVQEDLALQGSKPLSTEKFNANVGSCSAKHNSNTMVWFQGKDVPWLTASEDSRSLQTEQSIKVWNLSHRKQSSHK